MIKDLGLLLLRSGLALSMLPHGIKKLGKIVAGDFSFPDPIGIGEAPSIFLATFAEFACSILLILGVKTRYSAIPLAFTMFVAAVFQHSDDPWNKKELAVVYLTGFLSIALLGGGKYSIDRN